ncbi:MAG: hypothetical protein F6K30_01935 [Cyanothece sp. SIO2G6]|nr:hypothetical protein [Cyanothece sp. SIO2G6]
MPDRLTCLDLTQGFCDVDDFYNTLDLAGHKNPLQLPHRDVLSFKQHLIINDKGELLAAALTPERMICRHSSKMAFFP